MSQNLKTEERQIIRSTNFLNTNFELDLSRDIGPKTVSTQNRNNRESSPNESFRDFILVEKTAENFTMEHQILESNIRFSKPPKNDNKAKAKILYGQDSSLNYFSGSAYELSELKKSTKRLTLDSADTQRFKEELNNHIQKENAYNHSLMQRIRKSELIKSQKVHALQDAKIMIKINSLKMKKHELEEFERVVNQNCVKLNDIVKLLEKSENERKVAESRRKKLFNSVNDIDKKMKLIEIDVKSTYKQRQGAFSEKMDCIVFERLKVHKKLEKVNRKLALLHERKRMVVEDRDSKIRQKTELMIEMEEIEAFIHQLNQGDDSEIKLLIEEHKSEKRIEELKKEIGDRKSLILSLEKEVISKNRRIETYESIHKEVKVRVTGGLRKRDEEMKSIKSDIDVIVEAIRRLNVQFTFSAHLPDSLLNLKSKSNFFLRDIIRDIGKGIEIDVLRLQLKMVEKEKINFESNFKRKVEQFKKPILENYEDSRLENFKMQYMKKLSSLENWKNGLSNVIKENENDDHKQYMKVYNIFKSKELKIMIKNLVSPGEFSPIFEELLDQLLELLGKYEKIAGKKSKIFISEKETMEDCEMNILELSCHRDACESLIEDFFGEIKNYIKEKKDIEEYCEENRYALEAILTSSAEERFKELETSRAEEFKKIARTYGSKRLNEIRIQKKEELIEKIVQEKKIKFGKILKYQDKMREIQAKLQNDSLEKELGGELDRVKAEIIIQKGLRTKLEQDENVMVEKEEELVNKLNLLQLKQKEILEKRYEGIKDLIEKRNEDKQSLERCDVFLHEVKERISGLQSEIEQFKEHRDMIQTKKAKIVLEIDELKRNLRSNEIKHKHEMREMKDRIDSMKENSNGRSIESKGEPKKLRFVGDANCPSPDQISLNQLFFNMRRKNSATDRGFLSDLSSKYANKSPLSPDNPLLDTSVESLRDSNMFTQRLIRDKLKMNIDKQNRKTYKREMVSVDEQSKVGEEVKVTPFNDDLTTRVDTSFKKGKRSFCKDGYQSKSIIPRKSSKKGLDKFRKSFNCISGNLKIEDNDEFSGMLNKRKSDGMVKYRSKKIFKTNPTQEMGDEAGKNDDEDYKQREENKIYDKLFGGPRNPGKKLRGKYRRSFDFKNFGIKEDRKPKNKRLIKSQRVSGNKKKKSSHGKISNGSPYNLNKYAKVKEGRRRVKKDSFSNSLGRSKANLRRRKSNSRDRSFNRTNSRANQSLNLQFKPNSTKNSTKAKSFLQQTHNEEKMKYLKNPVKKKFKSHFLEKTFTSLYQKSKLNVRTVLEGNKSTNSVSGSKGNLLSFKNCSDPWNCKKHKKYYKINTSRASIKEMEIFRLLRPLLQGTHFYKKFTSSSLRRDNFNPRYCIDKPPESCGYGIRFFRVNLFTKKLEIMNSNRLVCEKSIRFRDFLRINNKQYEDLKKDGLNKIDMIPFEIIVCKEGAIKLVSLSYDNFKDWVRGLSSLMKNSSRLGKLASKVKCFCV